MEPGLRSRLARVPVESGRSCSPHLPRVSLALAATPEFQEALRRARALSDPRRLMTLWLLRREGELCACEVQSALGLNHSTVSHHMRELVRAGLVRTRREGKWIHYSLAEGSAALWPIRRRGRASP